MNKYTVERDWEYKGLRCVVIGIHGIGHRCGYVGLTKNHPLYELDYSAGSAKLKKLWDKVKNGPIGKRGIIPVMCRNLDGETLPSCNVVFDVHGGITYSGGGEGKYPVESDLWWFGFDCGHCDDKADPSLITDETTRRIMCSGLRSSGVIRTTDYVVTECESLVDQLVSLVPSKKSKKVKA